MVLQETTSQRMEIATMGKVLVAARIENLADLLKTREGVVRPEEVRSVEVANALVDTVAAPRCCRCRHV